MTRKDSIPFGKWPISISPVSACILKDSKLLSMTSGNRRCIQPAKRKQVFWLFVWPLSGVCNAECVLHTHVCTPLWKTVSFKFSEDLRAGTALHTISIASSSHCRIASAWCWPGASSLSSETSSSRISQGMFQSPICSAEEKAGCCRLPPKKWPAWS